MLEAVLDWGLDVFMGPIVLGRGSVVVVSSPHWKIFWNFGKITLLQTFKNCLPKFYIAVNYLQIALNIFLTEKKKNIS